MQDVREAYMQGRNSAGAVVQRPLSPHLQAYRPQMSSVLSILSRITGVILSFGAILLSLWLAAAARSPHAFAVAQSLADSIFGMIVLFGFTLSLFYHFCAGIRHLGWDAGYGYDLPTMYRTGSAVLIGTVGLTLLFWVIGLVLL